MTQIGGDLDRFNFAYDDMQGNLSSVSGGSALGSLAVRDTGLTIPSFQNNNNDVLFLVNQFSHSKRLNSNAGSFHIHCYLPTAPTAGNTVILDWAYTWQNVFDIIPAFAEWVSGTKTHTFSTEPQFGQFILSVIPELICPVNETASSMLLIKVTRRASGTGRDTYLSDLGIVYADTHYQKNRLGTLQEFQD